MMLLFVVLCFGFRTSLLFHEFAGISIFVLYVIHLVLNASWIKNIFSGGRKKLSPRNQLYAILDGALLVGMIVILISGVLISKILFHLDMVKNVALASTIHSYTSYFCLATLLLHVGLHMKYLVRSFQAMAKNWQATGRAALASALIVAVFSLGYLLQKSKSAPLTLPDFLEPRQANAESVPPPKPPMPGSMPPMHHGPHGRNDTIATTTTLRTSTILNNDKVTTSTANLSDYLGNLFCTGCHKHCSLLYPQCGIGNDQARVATEKYEQSGKKNTSVTTSTTTTVNKDKAVASTTSLNDYLGTLFCTACSKHCSLLYPQCGKGVRQAEFASQQYAQTANKSTSPTK